MAAKTEFRLSDHDIIIIYLLWVISNPGGTVANFVSFMQTARNQIDSLREQFNNLIG